MAFPSGAVDEAAGAAADVAAARVEVVTVKDRGGDDRRCGGGGVEARDASPNNSVFKTVVGELDAAAAAGEDVPVGD